ncbi:MAG: hypothetical protein LBP96_05610, partial [Bacteroidales bacterium]|nr:hypothetical protein [Bacteroidales bacterium]
MFIEFLFVVDERIKFQPTLAIPARSFCKFDELSDEQINLLAFHIGMIELVSYWKATCSPKVVIKPFSLSSAQVEWWKKLYFQGLGEFFYVNEIHTTQSEFMTIECVSDIVLKKQHFNLDEKIIVPIGGGKDSVVTLELLRKSQFEMCPMIINPRGATLNCAKIAGFNREQIIEVNRTIHPRLLELNAEGFLNGHTPFSAMLAFVSLLTSAVAGMKHIALSNESSANEATVLGQDVNHQYSKSLEFENDFRDYVKNFISEDFNYFSFLRPLNELTIAKYFSEFPQYHSVFRSCNVGSKDDVWCCNCAKCLFAFIILSPFIEPKKMIEIFGIDLLNAKNLNHEFNQLIGIENVKPFECVGTIDEVNIALNLHIQRFPNHTPALIEYYKTLDKFSKNFIMKKSNYIEPDSDDVNMASEPAMTYGYANQTNYEPPVLVEKFNEVTPKPQAILQPDDDFRMAITAEEL